MAFPDAVQEFTYTVDGVLTGVSHNRVSWGSWTKFDVFKRATTFQAYDNGGWTNTTDYTYDVDPRLSRIVQKEKNRSVVQDLSYGYDAVGNVTTIADNRTTKRINGINTDLTQSFAYDALNRLCATWMGFYLTGPTVGCTTTFPAPTATFTYDGIGNLLTDSGTTNVYFTTSSGERGIENRTGTIVNWRAYHDTEGKRTRFGDCSVSPCVTHNYGYDYRGADERDPRSRRARELRARLRRPAHEEELQQPEQHGPCLVLRPELHGSKELGGHGAHGQDALDCRHCQPHLR